MEGFIGAGRRSLGAHYTHEADIMKIVRPTIVRPWRERIDQTSTPDEALRVLNQLCEFRVLDPACGCGNFLYIAYRELRGLEYELKARIRTLAASTGWPEPAGPLPYYPLGNLHGLDIEPVVVTIARVTLWMGHRQMIDRFGPAEPTLPLVALSSITAADALRVPWPEVDCIVGNPPFLGSQHIRSTHGDDYIRWLKDTFKVGVKDYCVYWFRRTHDHLRPGQRAGLVGTNSVSQNRARSESLEYLTGHGGVITDAVSSQKWPGEAKVHVSLVNWTRQPPEPPSEFLLDGEPVTAITPELRSPERSTGEVASLPANQGRCFQGPIPVGVGFLLKEGEAKTLPGQTRSALPGRGSAVSDRRRHRGGSRAATRRWILDFAQLPLEAAAKYPDALDILRERVKSVRATNNRRLYRERWWQFGEGRPGLRAALAGKARYIAGGRLGKRLLFCWADSWVSPSDQTIVVALEDDYSMGVLSSFSTTPGRVRAHRRSKAICATPRAQSSRLSPGRIPSRMRRVSGWGRRVGG